MRAAREKGARHRETRKAHAWLFLLSRVSNDRTRRFLRVLYRRWDLWFVKYFHFSPILVGEARERASERRSHEGWGKGDLFPPLVLASPFVYGCHVNSREYPKWRACSQAKRTCENIEEPTVCRIVLSRLNLKLCPETEHTCTYYWSTCRAPCKRWISHNFTKCQEP